MFVPGQLGTLRRRVRGCRRLEARWLIVADRLDGTTDPELERDDSGQADSTLLVGSPSEDSAFASVRTR